MYPLFQATPLCHHFRARFEEEVMGWRSVSLGTTDTWMLAVTLPLALLASLSKSPGGLWLPCSPLPFRQVISKCQGKNPHQQLKLFLPNFLYMKGEFNLEAWILYGSSRTWEVNQSGAPYYNKIPRTINLKRGKLILSHSSWDFGPD